MALSSIILCTYADDTCILASSPKALQNLLNICSDFAYTNDVVFNESKTKLMCYKPSCWPHLHVPDIVLNTKAISIVKEHRYLGILLQNNQNDEDDMKRHVKAIYSRGNILVDRFRNCSTNVKNYLFRAYCSNAYGCQLWATYRKPMYQKVKVAYNDVYRKLLNIRRGESISTVYVSHNIDSFCVLLRKLVYSLKCRLCSSENELIKSVMHVSVFGNSKLSTKWNSILYL